MDKSFSRVLIIGFVWPEPGSSAAGRRMMQLITFFRAQNCDITFASTARKSEFSSDLTRLGIRSESIKVNDSGFDDFVQKLSPDLVIFDRFMTEEQFGWRVHDQCPDALRILDTEDLHCLRHAREMCIKNGCDNIREYLMSEIAKREIASVYRSDLSLIISESEINILRDVFNVPSDILYYLPYMSDSITEKSAGNWPDFNDRSGFMTIGNFHHKPNLDAVKYLRTDIWPLIRKLKPDAIMNVYGAYPTQQVREWHRPSEGFFIHGRAANANEVMRASRVCLAPLRFGAGLKGKLVEAMQNGTPSITTSLGAEGIAGILPWPGSIADKPVEFAEAAVHLYHDKGDWKQAQFRGREIINKRFSKKRFQNEFLLRLKGVIKELKSHRESNFTGAMLMHHLLASTRFMSKWIEAKNKPADQ